MTTKLLLPITLLLFYSCNSQRNTSQHETDSLKKYSYLFASIPQITGVIYKGTCSFYKFEEKYYLITVKHLFIEFPVADTMYVQATTNTGEIELFPVDVRKYKADTPQGNPHLTPDLEVIPVNIPSNYKIYSIEKFFKNYDSIKENPDSIFLFGYCSKLRREDGHFVMDLPCTTKGTVRVGITKPVYFANDANDKNGVTDTVNYYMDVEEKDYRGASGSPIFWVRPNNEIVFGGIVFQFEPHRGLLVGVKPEFIDKRIKSERRDN